MRMSKSSIATALFCIILGMTSAASASTPTSSSSSLRHSTGHVEPSLSNVADQQHRLAKGKSPKTSSKKSSKKGLDESSASLSLENDLTSSPKKESKSKKKLQLNNYLMYEHIPILILILKNVHHYRK